MQASWTFQSKEQAAEMQAIADHIILPYRKKLMPKVIRFEGEFAVSYTHLTLPTNREV